jgi:hypothetical protein
MLNRIEASECFFGTRMNQRAILTSKHKIDAFFAFRWRRSF